MMLVYRRGVCLPDAGRYSDFDIFLPLGRNKSATIACGLWSADVAGDPDCTKVMYIRSLYMGSDLNVKQDDLHGLLSILVCQLR